MNNLMQMNMTIWRKWTHFLKGGNNQSTFNMKHNLNSPVSVRLIVYVAKSSHRKFQAQINPTLCFTKYLKKR